jgi:hypothetical protein
MRLLLFSLLVLMLGSCKEKSDPDSDISVPSESSNQFFAPEKLWEHCVPGWVQSNHWMDSQAEVCQYLIVDSSSSRPMRDNLQTITRLLPDTLLSKSSSSDSRLIFQYSGFYPNSLTGFPSQDTYEAWFSRETKIKVLKQEFRSSDVMALRELNQLDLLDLESLDFLLRTLAFSDRLEFSLSCVSAAELINQSERSADLSELSINENQAQELRFSVQQGRTFVLDGDTLSSWLVRGQTAMEIYEWEFSQEYPNYLLSKKAPYRSQTIKSVWRDFLPDIRLKLR